MGLFKRFFNQTQKPEGFLGKLMVSGMNSGHAKLADWGMSVLDGITVSAVADLGCGGGRNAREILNRYSQAAVTALDYSEVAIEKTRKTNRKAIESGRCRVIQGDVSSLPFSGESFDLATAFETVYFWPGLEKCFSEVYRVLKPGGFFLICNESDGTDETALKYTEIIDGMRCYTPEQLTGALAAAGFSEFRTSRHPGMPWIAVLGRK